MIHALFLASGVTGLMYQVAWARDLALVFGASFEAQSIVLAAFMAGLAAGGFSFGRRAHRFGRPLRLYGLLEIGVAIFAVALPLLLSWVDAAYLAVASRAGGSDAWLNAARVAMAFAVLLLPTFCMGGTLPVLVRLRVQRYGELGERLSGLYAINTFGAVIGTLLAGFVLLPKLGVWRTELLAALANLVIGAVAIGLDRTLARRDTPSAEAPAGRPIPPAAGDDRASPAPASGAAAWPFRLAFWGTAVAGMGSLALEVAWSRAIAMSTGANTYSFSVMLATFLSGIAIGSRLHERVASRRFGVPVRLGVTLAGIGVSSALACLLIPRLPEIALLLAVKLYGGLVGIRAETTFTLSFLVMLVPCILMGMAFPLAAEARARLDLRFGESVGDLVGLNTVGAILGSLLAGFIGIPWLGLQRTMLFASVVYLGYGLVVLCAAWGAQRRERRGLAWAGALAALPATAALALVLPRWDMHAFAGLPNNDLTFLMNADGEVDIDFTLERTRLLYVREGRVSTVSVIGNDRSRSMLVNGRVVATDAFADMQHLYLLGHLPVLLHPDPRSAIVIGLGAGLTLGGIVAHETVERIVVVEIEPAVRDAAQLFADLHYDALADPRVELAWQDGRNYLKTTSERFDVITADPIHPWAQGGAYLYTTEYYRILADRLSPGGIACQWLPLYELSKDDLRSAIASFVSSFEHATLWQSAGDALLIGSNAPIGVDFDALEARLRNPRVSRQLARVGLDEPLSLLAEFAMDRAAMERFSEGATLNTDDNLHLEFSSPFAIGTESASNMLLIDAQQTDPGVVIRSIGSHFASRPELQARLAAFRAVKSRLIQAVLLSDEQNGRPTKAGLRELASYHRSALEQEPDYRHAKVRLAVYLASLGELYLEEDDSEAASKLFHQALEVDPGNAFANLNVGVEQSRLEQPERALAHFEAATERMPWSVNAQAAVAQALMNLGRFAPALERLRIAEGLRPDLAEIHRLSCGCLRELGELEAAVEKCRDAQSRAPREIQIALDLANTLELAGKPRDAVDTLREALAIDASPLAVRLRLAWLLSTSTDPGVRNGSEALGLVASAARRTENPRILDVLAAALAESGRFEQAAVAAAQAADLAEVGGHPDLARQIRAREAVYRTGRPIRSAQ
jgi:spermidine synthase